MIDYLAWVKNHRKSHHHLETYIKAYIIPRLGNVDTAKLTASMIRKWHSDIAAEPPRLRTTKGKEQKHRAEDPNVAEAQRKRKLRANRHLVTLRAALNRAWRDGHIARNDAWARVQLFPGTERARTRFLNHEQATRLINTCEPDLRNLVKLALFTGARYGELCAFIVGDFNSDSSTLYVRDSKSSKPRHIILNVDGAKFCKALVMGCALESPLLTKTDGTRWERDHQHRPFKAAIGRAKLDADFTFHELRHTWASLTIMAGAPLMVVAQNLGHRDTRMVERHYGHLENSYVAEMIRKTAPSFAVEESNVSQLSPNAVTS
jgi:integrase